MIAVFSVEMQGGYSYTVGGFMDSWHDAKASYFLQSRRKIEDDETDVDLIRVKSIMAALHILPLKKLDDISDIVIDGYVSISEHGDDTKEAYGIKLKNEISKAFGLYPTIIGVSTEFWHCNIPNSEEIERNGVSLLITSSSSFLCKTDAEMIKSMEGEDVLPSVICDVAERTKEFMYDDEEEINNV